MRRVSPVDEERHLIAPIMVDGDDRRVADLVPDLRLKLNLLYAECSNRQIPVVPHLVVSLQTASQTKTTAVLPVLVLRKRSFGAVSAVQWLEVGTIAMSISAFDAIALGCTPYVGATCVTWIGFGTSQGRRRATVCDQSWANLQICSMPTHHTKYRLLSPTMESVKDRSLKLHHEMPSYRKVLSE